MAIIHFVHTTQKCPKFRPLPCPYYANVRTKGPFSLCVHANFNCFVLPSEMKQIADGPTTSFTFTDM